MDIASQRRQEIDLADMLLAIQDCLIEMRNAPALRDIEGKLLRQGIGSLPRDVVAPSTEASQLASLGIKGQIPMHHRTDADSTDFGERYMIAAAHVGCHLRETGLDTSPGTVKIIRPDAVLQLVFPLIAGRRPCLAISVHEHSFDSCRPQLNTKGRFAIFNAGRILHKFHQ